MKFSEELRSERERRGITVEALCADTKVNQRFIDALEKGDYHALPGGVFRRGFVRAYLGAVGLDQQTWLEHFDTSYADYARHVGGKFDLEANGWITFAENVKKNRGVSKRSHLKQWLGVFVMLIALIFTMWTIFHFMLQPRVPHTQLSRQDKYAPVLAARDFRFAEATERTPPEFLDKAHERLAKS